MAVIYHIFQDFLSFAPSISSKPYVCTLVRPCKNNYRPLVKFLKSGSAVRGPDTRIEYSMEGMRFDK